MEIFSIKNFIKAILFMIRDC